MPSKPTDDGMNSESTSSSFREDLGLPEQTKFVPGPPPREANIDDVRAYHAKELPPEKNGEVRDLIMMFEGWRELSRQVLEERAKAYRGRTGDILNGEDQP